MTENLVRVQGKLGAYLGEKIWFLSISIDPENDDPTALKAYRDQIPEEYRKGWVHLTGSYRDIEGLRWRLGVYDLDPEIDADLTEHSGIVTFGNDSNDWWAALPAEMLANELTEGMLRLINSDKPSFYPRSRSRGRR